ncbi:hypothetical protein GOODEAATRI_009330, partial [Goodea atripinnis]
LGPRLYSGSPSSPAWTLSPPHPVWCCCTRLCLCWPRMMWQCHVSSSECRCYRLNGFSLLKRFPLSADGACGKALDQPVGEWLEHVGLPQYESKFLLNGFDDLRFMVSHLHHVISEVGSTLFHSRPCLCQLGFIYLFMSPLCSPTLHLSPTSSAPFITLSFSPLSP